MKDEYVLPVAVLAFGLIIVGLEILVMLIRKKGWGELSSRLVGITIVVVAAIFLVVTNIALERITLAVGLLGTVAGYLLGKNDKDKTTKDN